MTSIPGRVRRTVEEWLHPRRRAHAITRIRARRNAGPILVVCQGNICRSPFGAAVLARAGMRSAGSAGFIGPGRAVPSTALEAARRHNIDLAGHRSRLLTPAMLAETGLVVVMEPWQAYRLRRDFGWPDRDLLVLGDLDPVPAGGRRIADPYERPLAEFLAVYARIVRCTDALVALLAEPAGAPSPEQEEAGTS